MDAEFVKSVLFRLWSPVTVVTAASGSKRSAFPASSVTCCSFAPPNPLRITVQVMKQIYSYPLVQESQAFAVNVLSQDHMELVRLLAKSGEDQDKLASIPHHTGVTGSPLLDDAVAYLDCRVVNSMDAGDRTVFLADVVDGQKLREGDLLAYDYYRTTVSAEAQQETQARMASIWADVVEQARNVHRGS